MAESVEALRLSTTENALKTHAIYKIVGYAQNVAITHPKKSLPKSSTGFKKKDRSEQILRNNNHMVKCNLHNASAMILALPEGGLELDDK